MEALVEYLNNLFHGVKETPEVLRAKAELLQMMEDKYEELIAEGKNEDEAVGIVISEFGNFEEIADELGIGDAVKSADGENAGQETSGQGMGAGAAMGAGVAGAAVGAGAAGQAGAAGGAANRNGAAGSGAKKKKPRRQLNWGLSDVENYIKFAKRHARMVAFGVALCILAPYMNSVLESVLSIGAPGAVTEAISTSMFFACIAGAVALFIIAGQQTKQYGRVNRDVVVMNGGAVMEMEMASDEWSGRHTACIAIGVVVIILGPMASSLDKLFPGFIGDVVSCTVLLFAAIGVGLLIYASSVSNRFKELAKGCSRTAKEGITVDAMGGSEGSAGSGDATGADAAGAGETSGMDAGAAGTSNGSAADGTGSTSGAGAQSGAKTWEYKQKKGMPTWALILLIVGAFLAINVGINIFRGVRLFSGFGLFGSVKTSHYDGNKTFSGDSVERIAVDLSSAKLTIEESDSSEVVVTYSGNFYSEPKTSQSGRELTINEDSGFHLFGFRFGGSDGSVTVRVPKKKKISYELDLSAGDLHMQGNGGLEVNKLEADLSAGKMTVNNVRAEQIDVDLSAGDLEFNQVLCPGKAHMDLSAGKVNITGSDLYKVDADLSMGAFFYELPQPKKEMADKYDVDLDVSLGNIRFLEETDGDDLSHEAKVDSGEERFFKVDASLGDITIQ